MSDICLYSQAERHVALVGTYFPPHCEWKAELAAVATTAQKSCSLTALGGHCGPYWTTLRAYEIVSGYVYFSEIIGDLVTSPQNKRII